MRFDIVTIFPEFFSGPLDYGIVRRAREARLIETQVHDLRDFTHDRHRTVDDRPFGGGAGMVLKPEPLFEAVESLIGEQIPPSSRKPIRDAEGAPALRLRSGPSAARMGHSAETRAAGTAIVLLSAAGKLFRQETARRFAKLERIVLLCGRYEGVDERVAEHLATDEISIGDFVLSGGELPAAMIVDAVTRLIPGALGNVDSAVEESFSEPEGVPGSETERARHGSAPSASSGQVALTTSAVPLQAAIETRRTSDESRITSHGILDYPHYTRPPSFRGWDVPEVLMSGNHEEIRRWRRQKAIEKTLRNRPDLLEGAALGAEERSMPRES